jgi:PKD repeat protein
MRRRRWAGAQEHFGGIVSQPCIAAGPASGEAAASRQTPRLRSAGALLAWLLGFLLIIGLLVGAPVDRAAADTAPVDPLDPSTPVTVSDDALPAPQINGVVWSQVMIGNFVYVGGSFSNARPAGSPAGQNTVARGNFLAFNVTTGQLMTNVTHSFNAQVRSVFASPDKTKLYVAGEFTTVNGQTRRRIAEFTVNGNTGALTLTGFAPSVNYDVDAVVATNSKVFAGGSFQGVGNADRQYLAAFTAGTGALLEWAPQATGGTVNALTINPEGTKVVAGGSFTAMNGSADPGYGLAMLDTGTADGRDANGDPLTFEVNDVVRNGTADGAITTLNTDGTYIYGGGYTFGRSGGTWEGTFSASWDEGKINFLNDCHGDTYSVQPVGPVVYSVGHTHYCENIDGPRQGAGGVGDYPYFRATATTRAATGTVTWEPDQGRYYNFEGQPAPAYLGWYPDLNAGTYTGQAQGPWSLTGNSSYIVLGGEFTRVNNTNQQGLVRFAVSSIAPDAKGPKLFNASYPLNVTSTAAGTVRINWRNNDDDDNENLTYRVYRDTQNSAGLKHTLSKRIRRWETVTMGFTDTGVPPGSHQYRVVVTDPWGNTVNSPWTTVTVPAAGDDSAYMKAVYDDQPTNYWRMGESTGTTASADRVGLMPLSAVGTTVPVRGQPGAISNDPDTASAFTGVNTSWTASAVQHWAPDVMTLEAWFKTTVRGGRIAGWSTRNTQGNSPKHDRQLYIDTAGKLNFGARPNAQRLVVTSPNAVDDGQWHHAVGSLSKNGLKLYLDGQQVGLRTDVTVGEHLNIGYWRIGGDTVSGWPNAGTNGFFTGSVDEVAVYKHELTPADIVDHYAKGASAPVENLKPVASFTTAVDGFKVTVDGSASTDNDGTISSYEWDFGDGSTATGVTPPAHTYQTSGAKTVTLTVTDDKGAVGTTTRQVLINTAPKADFTFTVSGNVVALNASTSTDPENNISSYGWTFGDGSNPVSSGNPLRNKTYANSGTYDVTLTVTDAGGLTDSVTKQVTVVAPNRPPVAAFTTATQGLKLTVDGSGSSDPDGAADIDSYAWDFGDTKTDTGATPPVHTYEAGGTYNVKLTVTDKAGASTSLTRQVTVSALPPAVAEDEFDRTQSNGWGSADTGGAWTIGTGNSSNYSVSGGVGKINLSAAGSSRRIGLNDVSSSNTEVRTVISLDKAATGGSTFLTVLPRVRTNDWYFVDTRYMTDGTVQLRLGRHVGSTDTILQTATVSGLTVAPGDKLNFKVQATGTTSTTLRAKVWKVGTTEPSAWGSSTTDTTAALQGAGSIGFEAYLSSSATNAPQVASFDDLWAGTPQ